MQYSAVSAADRFYADLIGEPIRRRRPRRRTPIQPWPEPWEFPPFESLEDAGSPEAVPRGGRGAFRHDPLGGDAGDNVEARFNVDSSTTAGSTIDIVVYLHGYGSLQRGETGRAFITRKAVEAGLDMLDASGAVRLRASRPTLTLAPRGRNGGGRTWYFDRLGNRTAFDALVNAGVVWLCDTVLGLPPGSRLSRGRLTLMAHSGGGAGLSALLSGPDGIDPDEIVCFDSMYGGEAPIINWMKAKVASAAAPRSGLRAFYTGCGGASSWSYSGRWILQSTEPYARRLQYAIEDALKGTTNGSALGSRFRVQQTRVAHGDIPATYAPKLLDDIATEVSGAAAPPDRRSRPSCVANDDWLTPGVRLRKPGGEDPPPPPPSAKAEALLEDERAYDAPDRRPYSPATSATIFRTPPNPVAVSPATEWPETVTDGDRVTESALRALGVSAADVASFSKAGVTSIRPIATAFGEPALVELLGRLRYSATQLVRPPHSYASDAAMTRAFGRPVSRPALLAMRALLAIPGHFRQLARQAGNEPEAHALENVGWLLLQALRDEVRTASGIDFWTPAPPTFVTPFADPVPGMSPQTERLIVARRLIDSTLDAREFQARYESWRRGPAGRSWRLETGRESVSGRVAGAPYYPELVAIPPAVNLAPQRAQVHAAWARRVSAVDGGKTTVPLTRCDNAYLTPLHVMSRVSLRGLQLRSQFPSPVRAPALTSLMGLAVVRPAFEAVFQAIVDLGWNDLVFETQGLLCFRGKKTGNPATARHMSEHGLGIAIDLNVFENGQHTPGSMDPRIVALFEAFRFKWGKSFPVPDPMHFEYAG